MKLHPTSLAAVVLAGVGGAWAQNKACALATPAELKASLGMKVAGLKESNMGPHPFVSARLPRRESCCDWQRRRDRAAEKNRQASQPQKAWARGLT